MSLLLLIPAAILGALCWAAWELAGECLRASNLLEGARLPNRAAGSTNRYRLWGLLFWVAAIGFAYFAGLWS